MTTLYRIPVVFFLSFGWLYASSQSCETSIDAVNVACFGGANGSAAATLSTNAISYNWSNGATSQEIQNLTAGTYTVTATDAAGCQDAATIVITEPPLLSVSAGQFNQVSCFGGNNGSVTVTPTGGAPNYTFLWSNGQTTGKAMNLIVGTYTVTVTDANGCSITQTASITQPPAITASLTSTAETVSGANNGTATVMPAGGTPVYTYQWNTGGNAANISGLSPGMYLVTVTDMQGCSTTGSVIVAAGTSPGGGCSALPVYALYAPAQVCGHTPFNLEADDLYPNPVVQYEWHLPNGDTVATSQPFLTITANSTAYSGAYFVLRDSLGCRSVPVGGTPVTIVTVDNITAGNDAVLCSAGQVPLTAVLPTAGIAFWVSLGAATVDNPNQYQTFAHNLQPGPNAFVWQVSLGNCPHAAADTVVYFLENKPAVHDDRYTLPRDTANIVMEVLLNDALGGLQDTNLILVNTPSTGQLVLLPNKRSFRYTGENDYTGKILFEYAVCSPNSVCSLPCDTATVTIVIQPSVPEGLVVNDPGLNGRLTIKGISTFTRVEMTITDRWGSLVFQEKEYRNDNPWLGDYKRSGHFLPGGAYYYFLKTFDGDVQAGNTLTGVIHLFE